MFFFQFEHSIPCDSIRFHAIPCDSTVSPHSGFPCYFPGFRVTLTRHVTLVTAIGSRGITGKQRRRACKDWSSLASWIGGLSVLPQLCGHGDRHVIGIPKMVSVTLKMMNKPMWIQCEYHRIWGHSRIAQCQWAEMSLDVSWCLWFSAPGISRAVLGELLLLEHLARASLKRDHGQRNSKDVRW